MDLGPGVMPKNVTLLTLEPADPGGPGGSMGSMFYTYKK